MIVFPRTRAESASWIGEVGAAFSHHGVVPLGQRHDEVMAAGRFGRGDHFLLSGVRAAEADVIADGVVEQVHILKYHGNVAQEAVAGHLPDVMAAHDDASLIHIIKPGQQCAEGALLMRP